MNKQEQPMANSPESYKMTSEGSAELATTKETLVPYLPKSKAPYRLDTLIPKNMAFEVQKSLNSLVRKKGNIDNYVRNELKYASTKALWDGLAAEQVDSIGLYLWQFEKEQGVIIADQTGIGKGRQAAAVIRHAKMHGYLPVFFTKNPDLFTDMYRDLKAIGAEKINPFILNTDTNARIKDADGTVVFTPVPSETQMELIATERTVATYSTEAILWHRQNGVKLPDFEQYPEVVITDVIDTLPEGYDMIFATYSQVQLAHPYKRQWLNRMADMSILNTKAHPKLVFVLDESHMAGGYNSNIGKWMRQVLPKIHAACFLSATFAKYPQVMPFYAKKTAISEAGMSDSAFVYAMTSGGLSLQEIVASNLSESGQLLRRQRSNEGIKVSYITLNKEPERSKNRKSVDRIISLMNKIVDFEKEYISPIYAVIHAEAKRQGESMPFPPQGLGVRQSPYFSRVFNVVDQMLFALKVEEVANHTLELLHQDKKVVIAFKSTMGSFLKDLNLASGDELPEKELDFVRTLIKGLDGLFNYSYTDIEGNKTREKIAKSELGPRGMEVYRSLKKAILLERSGLSISPIDQLIAILQKSTKPANLGGHDHKYFTVAEVTGRNQRLVFDEDIATVESFRSDGEKSFRLFNKGTYDVLLINQSGSTGSSAHASKDFADQRVRAMIVHQFELDINTEIQKRGRINRTGQVALPEYYYITSDIPTEKRLMVMLKAKLKSLDANTTGSQKTNEATLESADFLNKYGDLVAHDWVDENPDLTKQLGYPTYTKKRNSKTGEYVYVRNIEKSGAVRQLTGRAGLLTVADQEELYENLLERYDHQVKLEKQQGTYDLEIEFLPLDAEVKKSYLFRQGSGGASPFGTFTAREETIVNNLNRPFVKKEIDERIASVTGGRKPTEVRFELERQINAEYPQMVAQKREQRMKVIRKLEQELQELPSAGSKKTTEKNERLEHTRANLENLLVEKRTTLQSYIQHLEHLKTKILRYIGYWEIGQVVKIPGLGAKPKAYFGIFLGITMGKAKNKFTASNFLLRFAVAHSLKIVQYTLQDAEIPYLSMIYTESKDLTEAEQKEAYLNWNAIIKEVSAKREKRQILTKNIVGVGNYITTENRLIKYNTKDGTMQNGILMDRDYGKDNDLNKSLYPISKALPIIENLPMDDSFTDAKEGVRFKRMSESIYQVYFNKSEHYQLMLNEELRSLLQRNASSDPEELPDFVQNGGDMVGVFPLSNLRHFLKVLDQFGIVYLGTTRELEDWEKENEADWEERGKAGTAKYHYRLGRAYGQGSNPTAGFTDYKEPSPEFLFGTVSYERKLSDKEKYNYSLIPIFDNVGVPYAEWLEATQKTAIASEFQELINEVKEQPIHEAIRTLGYFITNHPHEDGNTEFVFGNYSPEELGRNCYEKQIKTLTKMEKMLVQLDITLE